ncbi:MAG: Gfo/Idh/MocA family oxidoreductase [Planctomycetes bacterium]|nr:Gfo/Idh/MocA family oxidoreductase [Planctomycetota bacterium]
MAGDVRIGMIGMGGFMHRHSEDLGKIPEARVVAVMDPVAGNRAAHKKRHAHLAGAAEYDDWKAMLRREHLDAVVIASPHTAHFEQIMAALDRGLHVLVEKPLVCRIDHGRKVVRKVRKTGLVLSIGYHRHTAGMYRYVRREIAAGRIGKVEAVAAFQAQEWKRATAGTWRQAPALSGGGQLNDSGSHLVDVILWMTGLQADVVSAHIHNCGTPVDINSAVSVRFAGGAVGAFAVAGNAPAWWEDISIVGDRGAFHMRQGAGLTQQLGFRDAQAAVSADALGGASVSQDFIRAIQGRQEPAAPAECGLRVIELTEAAWKSAAQGGRPVKVPRTKI